MSAEAVKVEILEPMQRQFYPPKQGMAANDQAKALGDYVTALQGFDAADLKAAWIEVCGSHTKPAWPLPAVFVAAARTARKVRVPSEAISKREQTKATSAHRWETWVRVSRSEMAREAAREGCAWSLKCAALYDGKRPEEIDLRELIVAKRRSERMADDIRHGRPVTGNDGRLTTFSGWQAEKALGLWDGLLRAEAETQAEINHGARDVA